MDDNGNLRWLNLYRDQLSILHSMNLFRQYDGYICPFCLNRFNEDNVAALSLEDAPQEALGGSKVALTCKKCNNTMGGLIDCHLVNYIEAIECRQFPEGLEKRVTISNPVTGATTNALLRIESGQFKIYVPPRSNNPVILDHELPKWIENTLLNIEFADKANKRLPRNIVAAILKNAYVLLFAKFGYTFLLSPYYDILREQLFHPDKEILPDGFFHLGRLFANDGIYAVNDEQTRGFFIQYSLRKRQLHTCIGFIPAPCISFENAAESLKGIRPGSKLLCSKVEAVDDYIINPAAINQVIEWINSQEIIWPLLSNNI